MIPDIADFETRRELIRLKAKAKLDRLDDLHDSLLRADVTREAWIKAAEFLGFGASNRRPDGKPARSGRRRDPRGSRGHHRDAR